MTEFAPSWALRIGMPESFVAEPEHHDPETLPGGPAWGPMIDRLRAFLDALAVSAPPPHLIERLGHTAAAWTRELHSFTQSEERHRIFGHRVDLHGRGQVMAPAFAMTRRDADSIEGTVRFGAYFLGGNGAAHGGAIALFMDEVLGRLSDTSGRPSARTANLSVNYRAVTPVDKDLVVRAWFDEENGRKRYLTGQIWDGEVLCADARGLFLALKEGQQ